ncbi:MAG: non-canonical purine NTP pyrophosphatase [Candidatus Marsarchaeota archaeon]|jgi:XTP/dITP diphosphohydrolase|nr:non-canonical purine NTP pyrophosphatase [Candidatus Marsarchaeota archaeon]
MDIYFATSNIEKFKEAKRIIKKLKRINIEMQEPQSLSVEEVTKFKVINAYESLKMPIVVEDTGFYINALNGFPGALGKWLHSSIGPEGICNMISNYKNKRTTAVTCVAFYNGKQIHIFKGSTNGIISDKPIGKKFGFDPIFIPRGYEKTFGEMTLEIKNSISPRGKAFRKLRKFLEKSGNL